MKKLLSVILFAFTVTGLLTGQSSYKAGDIASDFNLPAVSGGTVSLAGYDDAYGFIVAFWCNSCPVVRKYEERLKALHDIYAPLGYPVVAVNPNDPAISPADSFDEMKKRAAAENYQFHYLFDESQEVARRYGATNTPHIYILSWRDGRLLVEYTGAIDNNPDDASAADKHYAEDALGSILKGEPVSVTGTRAVGCTIKWKKN